MFENTVTLIGNVGSIDAFGAEGKKPFARVSLATSKRFTNGQGEEVENTQWHNLRFFGKQVEAIKKHVSKGSKLFVSGELDYAKWQSEDGTQKTQAVIVVKKFIVFDRKSQPEFDASHQEWINEYDNAQALDQRAA